MHGLPRLSLVPENIPTRERHRRRRRLLRRERRHDAGGVGPEQRGAEERGVGAGAVVAALRRRGDVEEREFGGRSARNEAVGVNWSGRRGVVVGVDHSVDVAERRGLRGRWSIEVSGGLVHGFSGGAI